MSCGVGRRGGSDPTLLWLWCRPAVVALIVALAWEVPYITGMALKSKRKKKIDPQKLTAGAPIVAQQLRNLTSINEGISSIPGATQ